MDRVYLVHVHDGDESWIGPIFDSMEEAKRYIKTYQEGKAKIRKVPVHSSMEQYMDYLKDNI